MEPRACTGGAGTRALGEFGGSPEAGGLFGSPCPPCDPISPPGIYHCWREYSTLRAAGATISNVGFTTNLSVYSNVQETWLAALIILAVVEGILLLLLIFLRKRILIAIALIQESSRAIGYMMSTLFYPLVTFLLLLICVAYWAMTALQIGSSAP
nr:choline transporter-like protein 4 [Chelonoidis abingdonii]